MNSFGEHGNSYNIELFKSIQVLCASYCFCMPDSNPVLFHLYLYVVCACVYLCVIGCMFTCIQFLNSLEEGILFIELELQAIVSCPKKALGTKLGSS